MDWRDVGERAGWTFVQALLGFLCAAPLLELEVATLKVAVASALSAALVVLKEAVKERMTTRVGGDA